MNDNLKKALGCTEEELQVIFMMRAAHGELEQGLQRGESPFELMKRVELKHARKIMSYVRRKK